MGETQHTDDSGDLAQHAQAWGVVILDEHGYPMSMTEAAEDDVPGDDGALHLWPGTEKVVGLFGACANRWMVGPSGPVGLHLPSCERVARSLGIGPRTFDRLLPDLLDMETAALVYMAEAMSKELGKAGRLH